MMVCVRQQSAWKIKEYLRGNCFLQIRYVNGLRTEFLGFVTCRIVLPQWKEFESSVAICNSL